MSKRILFLGAAPTQIPPLRYALEQGHYVITCDYLPDNPGHSLANESYNVSTIEKDVVLDLKIDAIVAYASDSAGPTAAYVAGEMGLPGNPYEALHRPWRAKNLFCALLKRNVLNVAKSQSFYSRQEVRESLDEIGCRAFVKGVDSSGSKSVTRLVDPVKFDEAFDHALLYFPEKRS